MYTMVRIVKRNAWIPPINILKPCQTARSGRPNHPAIRMVLSRISPAKMFANSRIASVTGRNSVSIRLSGKKIG
ncbi:hypothetical protein D3C73_1583670 [compost metagenome]